MSDSPLAPRDDDDALAAEYVLGVQDPEERAALERRLKSDSAFAARVAAWEMRLSGLNAEFPPVPPPDLLPQIEARLFPQPLRAPSPARAARRGLGWLLAPLAAVLVVAALLFLTPRPGLLVAELATEGGDLAYEVRHRGAALTVTRVAGAPAGAGRVHELWILAPGAAPVSLGLLAGDVLEVAYPVPPRGWTLAVSLEPEGGSPTGAPTGPVLIAVEIGA